MLACATSMMAVALRILITAVPDLATGAVEPACLGARFLCRALACRPELGGQPVAADPP
jgi:hypothetical protein